MQFKRGQLIVGTEKANMHSITKCGCVGRFISFRDNATTLKAHWVWVDSCGRLRDDIMGAYADCFVPAIQKVS